MSCHTLKSSTQWQLANGGTILSALKAYFDGNKMIWKECLGQEKGDCKSPNSTCQKGGLRDQSILGGVPRPDMAAALFSEMNLVGFQCSLPIKGKGCEKGEINLQNPPCGWYGNGPGTFLMIESFATLATNLQNIYGTVLPSFHLVANPYLLLYTIDQIQRASDNLQAQVQSTSDLFANTSAPDWRLEVPDNFFAA